GLVVTQDFGTAAIIGVTSVAVLLVGGVRWYYLAGLVPFGAGAFYLFVVSAPHRWARIEAMLNPTDTSNPATYQPGQALIAIGSGVEPAGPGAGVAKYGYLPESQTDFIFANICEELGMLGAILVIGLLLLWLFLACRTAIRAPDRFGALLAGGLGFLIAFQATLHIAINIPPAPPTGVSLPFVSAGGSSLLLMSAATALIVSVSSRKKTSNQ
ncbi:MAG: FtsW/RodA/SpoVE family cell cycle protein, partial [Phycisphaerae bacterium]|nr:FtsW/RodA/SpoVE family cell cycle protein [Phycisphaerae bacterium]